MKNLFLETFLGQKIFKVILETYFSSEIFLIILGDLPWSSIFLVKNYTNTVYSCFETLFSSKKFFSDYWANSSEKWAQPNRNTTDLRFKLVGNVPSKPIKCDLYQFYWLVA